MQKIKDMTFDAERAFYGSRGLSLENCRFDGPADGESAMKESRDITANGGYFNLRYPFWHDDNVVIDSCELTPLCRAALWYTKNVDIKNTRLHGIKALRECADINIENCDIESPEFGWFSKRISVSDTHAVGEYFMLRAEGLKIHNLKFSGKYSFQYVENAVVSDCDIDTKDAFWHCRNVTVTNCRVKGEYLAWYAEDLTFKDCVIIGTQPLCYCRGLKLINCRMEDTDLSFEKSDVEATLTAPIVSIKNPHSGSISVPAVGEIIMDDPEARGQVIITG